MLRTLVFLAAGMVSLGTVGAQGPSTLSLPPVISLAISAVRKSVRARSPVRVKVVLTNKSSHGILVGREVRGSDCQIEVRDVNGHLARDTAFGSVRNGRAESSRVTPQYLVVNGFDVTVKAGETLSWELDASKWFDMTQPGKYSIHIQKRDPESLQTIVKSNAITVRVTP